MGLIGGQSLCCAVKMEKYSQIAMANPFTSGCTINTKVKINIYFYFFHLWSKQRDFPEFSDIVLIVAPCVNKLHCIGLFVNVRVFFPQKKVVCSG